MQIGILFPQSEIGADIGGIRAYAQAMQDIGYAHMLTYEHVLGADVSHYPGWQGPYTADHMFHEVFTLFAFIAGVAPKLELVPSVLVLPQRQTALVAKQAAQIDLLTGGRFRLGVGVGWNAVECEGMGEDFKTRGRRMEEQIEVLRRLWQEPIVHFEGKYHTLRWSGINPLPVQRPIPIWIGGSAESALKRGAEIADGYFVQRPLEGGWARTLARMREWREAAGRSWSSFGVEGRIFPVRGTPDDWRREAEEWRTLGATHLSVCTLSGGLQGPQAHIDIARQAWDALR